MSYGGASLKPSCLNCSIPSENSVFHSYPWRLGPGFPIEVTCRYQPFRSDFLALRRISITRVDVQSGSISSLLLIPASYFFSRRPGRRSGPS
jgi:hypothetical protein